MQIKIHNQAGASLIEIIMVVALMALITIAALTYYNSANEASKINQAVSDITALSSTIRATFASQGDYDGLTETVIYNMKSLNSNMKSNVANNLKHGWSQAATAVVITPPTSPFTTFSIQYGLLPQAACQDIASKLIGRFDSITATGGAVTNITTAMSNCSATGSTNTLTLVQR